MACGSWGASGSKRRVRLVDTITLQQSPDEPSDAIDVSQQGTLLVFPWGLTKVRAHIENRKARRQQYRRLVEQMKTQTHVQEQKVAREPRLLVWDYQRKRAAFEFPKNDEWDTWENKAPQSLRGNWQFRFQGDGSRIVAIEAPWLVLIDAKKQVEIARVLPSDSYLRKDTPGRPSADKDVSMCYLDVDRRNGLVAAAYNLGMDTHLYVYDSELKEQLAAWQLPRIVQDLRWSPDGKELAVLFNGGFYENRTRWYYGTSQVKPTEPDVWVIDVHSGKPLLKFWTGADQNQIAFSHDGKLVYVTGDSFFYPPKQRGAIRAFSAVSGALVQTITTEPEGVNQWFRLSADGSLIAADASTLPWGLHIEPITGAKIARVALLDAKTGRSLFEHHEETYGGVSDPLGMAFSPDGRLLFVDLPGNRRDRYQRIEVYSIDDVSGSKH
jgi:hypothetical protein